MFSDTFPTTHPSSPLKPFMALRKEPRLREGKGAVPHTRQECHASRVWTLFQQLRGGGGRGGAVCLWDPSSPPYTHTHTHAHTHTHTQTHTVPPSPVQVSILSPN